MKKNCTHEKEKNTKSHESQEKHVPSSSNNYTTCVKSNGIMEQNRLDRINSFKI
ncbi:hypothetical protein QBE52_15325 [Clostridiaceae bacterium 35-E11]